MGRQPPRYQQIKHYLLENIQTGHFPVDHKIPPEEQLAVTFGVSRMTANKAIRDLVQEGYLVRQSGIGTFVTDRRSESPLAEINNIADEVRSRGHDYTNRVLRCEALNADDEIALRMGVRIGTKLFHSILIHLENGLPIQLEDRYVNPRWVSDYLDADFSRHTPNEVLVAACPITDMEHIVEAVVADPQAAEWLDIGLALPCLSVRRRTWSGDRLISYAHLLHPGDRYKLRSMAHSPY
ncbi:histidine utilization repressor [Vreelandella boliviensis]|uniref:Histidine utilization repressor n=1 Tax=Vreelandella boliviensis LC1 TaxID=1072583 RepID=A0A265DV21_9GAMM|nr:histidine utilization repressor [Halomonas boliviensis]EHJ91194.1 Histidine utilization repressor [Halomonas boliviensis LC1]OZT73086.1 histidine utilization repressor [Halomonas boliviensis LC1]